VLARLPAGFSGEEGYASAARRIAAHADADDPAPVELCGREMSLLVDLRLSPETMLRDVEGLSTAEAAEALDLTEVNLKVRSHRARLLLRERLSEFVAAHGAPSVARGRLPRLRQLQRPGPLSAPLTPPAALT
jgi:hypothetical protein